MAVDNTCLSLGTQDLTCCSWNAIRPLLSSSSARNSSRSLQELLVWRRKWTGAQLWKKELGLIVLFTGSQFTRCQQEDRRRLSRQETPHDCNLGKHLLRSWYWWHMYLFFHLCDYNWQLLAVCLFVQHLPHVEDTDCCSRSLHPAHFCVIHQHNSRPEQDQNEAEILFQPLPSD